MRKASMGSGWQGRDGSELVEIVVKVPHLEREKTSGRYDQQE